MEKVLNIDGHEVKFKASGATPRIYRNMFEKEDVFAKMTELVKNLKNGNLENIDMRTIENIAYVMASQADPNIPDITTWLDQFSMFAIYQKLPEIIELWNLNNEQIESAKKKLG